MRLRNFLIAVAVLALAVPAAAVAAPPEDRGNGGPPTGFKVTGGGQIISEAQEAEGGPGDTVGFNAQEIEGDDERSPGDDDDAARGQFQYVPRPPEEGGNQPVNEKFHGVVTCLLSGGEAVANEEAEGDEYDEELLSGMARFGGYFRDDPTRFFTVDVTDNGQGGDAEDDLILVRETDAPCADNPEDEDTNNAEDLARLGRGNVKIHNNPDDPATAAAVARFAAGALN